MPLVPSTPARSFAATIRDDPRMRQMQAYEKAGDYHMPVHRLNAELIAMQAGRKFPRLSPQIILRSAQTTLLASRQETAALASRATHIKMVAHVKRRRLDRHIRAMKGYLAETYAGALRSASSTIKGREILVSQALAHFSDLSYDLETLMQTCDLLLKDLDNGSFAINFDYEMVKLGTRPARNI